MAHKSTKRGCVAHTTLENNDNIYCAYIDIKINDKSIEAHFKCPHSTIIHDQNFENKFYVRYQKCTYKNIELFSELWNTILNLNGCVKYASENQIYQETFSNDMFVQSTKFKLIVLMQMEKLA